ncbi:hypothetical protein BKA64DRAFT_198050 [Cadophora sp. MPI-SDFR-AT-0126]|nr:hypothetical protein BKA64DRAFT_198050 [Leotiomycetes sp. MPI-SDFR-AT-0126]
MTDSPNVSSTGDWGSQEQDQDVILIGRDTSAEVTPLQHQSSTDNQEVGIQEPDTEELKFTLFPKLPVELRFKIWRDAQPHPRVIDIIFTEDSPNHSFSTATPPVLLYVCRESRSETLRIYKGVSKLMKSSTADVHRPIYIDPLEDVLLIADDWKTAPADPDGWIPLDNIVSWLDEDILKAQKRLAIGLAMLDDNSQARPPQPALLALAKFQSLDSMTAVLSPYRRQRSATEILYPYGLRPPTPPLLAPDEEAWFAIYLSPDVQYAKPVSEGGDPYFAELDEVMNLREGEDRTRELEDLLEEMQDELDVVSLENPKWRMPLMGVAALH